jgi:hypothetical protein
MMHNSHHLVLGHDLPLILGLFTMTILGVFKKTNATTSLLNCCGGKVVLD